MALKDAPAAGLFFLLIAQMFLPLVSNAASETIIPLSGTRIACVEYQESFEDESVIYHRLAQISENGGIMKFLDFSAYLQKSGRIIRQLRSKIASSASQIERNRFKRRQKKQRHKRSFVRNCRDGRVGSAEIPTQDSTSCEVFGARRGSFFARIINGEKCNIGDSSVVYLRTSNGISCTGTAISKRVILTAAHCVTDTIGRINVNWVDAYTAYQEGGQSVFRSSNVKVPPWYAGGVSRDDDDSALVFFSSDLPARPMKLLQYNDLSRGEKMHIAGYGRIGTGQASGNQTDGLQAASMKIRVVKEGNIVARFNHNKNGLNHGNTCSGDSGGPAVVFRDLEWKIAGITSYGFNSNCGPNDRSGFQNVTDSKTREFIAQHVPDVRY
jgi:hypothetical protein